jgi:hypothetical protein
MAGGMRILLSAAVSCLLAAGCSAAPSADGSGGGGSTVPGGSSGGGGSGSGNGNVDGVPGSGSGGDGSGGSCGGMEFALSKVPPNVMLVIDRSGSMKDPIANGSSTSKYADLTTAVQSLVRTYDTQMRLGATFYSADDNCAPGSAGFIGPVGGGSTVVNQVARHLPAGNTPTASTLESVIRSGQLTDPTRANYVVLATDGLPNCGDVDVTGRIQRLYGSSPSVSTFVIGLGSETNSNAGLLNEWADAGHTAKSGSIRYQQTNSPDKLRQAFDEIVGAIAVCSFKMAQAAPDPTLITVSIDGQPVSPSPTQGYSYDAASNTITLHGPACDALRNNSSAKVSVVYGCPGLPPIS